MSDHAFWVLWLTLVSGFILVFLPFEFYAIAKGKAKVDTLSAFIWGLIGTRKGWHLWNTPLRIGVFILFAWLAEHFAFGII